MDDYLIKSIQHINSIEESFNTKRTSCQINKAVQSKLSKLAGNLNHIGFKNVPHWKILLSGLNALEENNPSLANIKEGQIIALKEELRTSLDKYSRLMVKYMDMKKQLEGQK